MAITPSLKTGRTTDEDVAAREVGDERIQQRPVERHLRARTDDLVEMAVMCVDELRHLGPVDEIVLARGAEHDHDVDRSREFLEDRAHRRHADARGDQRDAVAGSGVMGKRAVRALDHHPGARPEGQRARLWSPLAFTVSSHRGTRQRRERIGVCVPHSSRVRNRHLKNCPPLTANRSSERPLQMTTAVPGASPVTETTRNWWRRLLTSGWPIRKKNDGRRDGGPHDAPDDLRHRMADERHPVMIWWAKASVRAEVGVEWTTHHVSYRILRRTMRTEVTDASPRGEPGHRREEIGITGDEGQICEDSRTGGLGVAEGDEDDVGADRADRPGRGPPVPTDETLLADDALERAIREMSTTMTSSR